MRIYYYSGATLPSHAAKSVHVMKMCEALAKIGHDVTLFAKGLKGEDVYAHYGVAPCFKIHLAPHIQIPIISGALRVTSAFLHALKAQAPDLIYGRDIIAVTFAPSKAVRVFEAHQMPIGLIHRALMRLQKNMVVISQGLKNDIQSVYPNLNRICVAHDGANIVKSIPTSITLKKTPQNFHVGYAGSLQAGKGAFFLMDLAKRKPDIHFHLWGGNAKEVSVLNKRKPENVTLYGYIPHGRVVQYLKPCDVLVAPYLAKAIIRTGQDIARWISPMKLFEYMSVNKPIISSNLPVIREILSDNQSARLVEPENLEAWSDALDSLCGDAVLRKKLAQQANNDLIEHYTWEKRAAHIIKFCTQSL